MNVSPWDQARTWPVRSALLIRCEIESHGSLEVRLRSFVAKFVWISRVWSRFDFRAPYTRPTAVSANCRKPVRHPRWPGGPHGPFASVRRSPGVRRVRFRTKVFTLEGQIWPGSSVCGRSGRIQADLEVGSPAGQRSGAWPAWRLRVATRGHGKSRESPVAN